MLASGAVRPLQSLVYNFSAITTALRQFSHARHVGKIVVRVPPAAAVTGAARTSEAWAVTGGLGALGAIAAEWLVGQGVKHIHLLGRTGRWHGQPAGGPWWSLHPILFTPTRVEKPPGSRSVVNEWTLHRIAKCEAKHKYC